MDRRNLVAGVVKVFLLNVTVNTTGGVLIFIRNRVRKNHSENKVAIHIRTKF